MATPFTVLNRALKPFRNLLTGKPVLATFQVNLRCNSACGYCDLPLNAGRYEMSRELWANGSSFSMPIRSCQPVRFSG